MEQTYNFNKFLVNFNHELYCLDNFRFDCWHNCQGNLSRFSIRWHSCHNDVGCVGATIGGICGNFLLGGGTGEIFFAVLGAILVISLCNFLRQKSSVLSNPQTTSKQQLTSITETYRSEEFLGEEQRVIDNSKSTISLTRGFIVSKEWSQSYAVEYEQAHTIGGGFNVGIGDKAGIKIAAEKTLRAQYSISEETRQTYAEEVVLEVPAQTKLRVFFRWKRVWQHGLVTLRDRRSREIEVPFRVVVGLTFDQAQVDEK